MTPEERAFVEDYGEALAIYNRSMLERDSE